MAVGQWHIGFNLMLEILLSDRPQIRPGGWLVFHVSISCLRFFSLIESGGSTGARAVLSFNLMLEILLSDRG